MVYLEPVGTGRSGRLTDRSDYRLDTYVTFLATFVEHLVERLHETRVYVLGHSHGGFVAQSYALAYPDRVAGLILYSTSPEAGPDFWSAAMAGIAAYPSQHPHEPEAAAVPASFQEAVTAVDDDTMSRAFAAALPVYFADFWSRREELEAFRRQIRMWGEPVGVQDPAPFDVRARLAELTMPTVVIVGRSDFICGPRWAAALAAGIPDVRVFTLEESGHFGHVEQPDEFAAATARVLLPASRGRSPRT